MIEFWQVLFFDPDYMFLRLAFFVGIFASFTFGIVGTFVVTRKISYLAGAISHCVFGGIGAGLYLQQVIGWYWFDPIYGAVIVAILAAIIIGIVSLKAKQREDTVIGALWAIGMATGLLFIDKVPGAFDMSSYLFGDILLISELDLQLVIILNIVVFIIVYLFYNKLLAVCYDEEFSQLRGINTSFYYILLLCITALTVVLLVRIVGIVLVIALLTLPPAIANLFSKRLWQMMIISIVFCIFFVAIGLMISFTYSFSSGATIIMVGGITYLGVILGKKLL